MKLPTSGATRIERAAGGMSMRSSHRVSRDNGRPRLLLCTIAQIGNRSHSLFRWSSRRTNKRCGDEPQKSRPHRGNCVARRFMLRTKPLLRHLTGLALCVAVSVLPGTLHANPICRPDALGRAMVDAFGRPCLFVPHGLTPLRRGEVLRGRVNSSPTRRPAVETPRFGFTTGPSGPFTTGSLNSAAVPRSHSPHRR